MRRAKHLIYLLTVPILLLPGTIHGKEVKIQWKPIQGAISYELQVSKGEQALPAHNLTQPIWKGDLGPGAYSYQIRAIDRMKRPGQWSAPRPLIVMPMTVTLTSPKGGETVPRYSLKSMTVLDWEDVEGATQYRVELMQGEKVIKDVSIPRSEMAVPELPPGAYSWRVRAIVEGSQARGPASMQGKKWETKPSVTEKFSIKLEKLESPKPISPVGRLRPPSGGKLKFTWKPVEGALAYEVLVAPAGSGKKVRELAADKPTVKRYVAEDSTLTVNFASNKGEYVWQVRALASTEGENPSDASTAEFKLDPNAMFVEGGGYVALSGMFAPYSYSATSPVNGFQGGTSSIAMTARASSEYWVRPSIAVAVAGENTFFTIAGSSFNRLNFEVGGKYRASLNNQRFGWFIAPKLAFEGREYFMLFPTSSGGISSSKFMALGVSPGFDIRKQFNERWSLGAKLGYFLPLKLTNVDGSDASITKDASYRNVNVGAQAVYWIGKGFAAGAGGFWDNRSISYTQSRTPASGEPEVVYMDAIYFFGSLLYSF